MTSTAAAIAEVLGGRRVLRKVVVVSRNFRTFFK